MKDKIKQLSSAYFKEIVSIRRYLHQYPELSFNEHKTSAYIKSILVKWKIPFIDNIADTGIIVILKGKNPAYRTIALRADFDALPIQEDNKIPYCSKNNGVMHACGHDAHTACLLGAIKILNELKLEWEGMVKFIFQPAEEMLPGGAQQMIKEGVLLEPRVDKIIAQHVFPELEKGKVGFCSGKYMASTDELHIKIKGKGGHAALPEEYNNPILAASKLTLELDLFLKKKKENKSVIAIGFIEGLGSTNIIPENVILKGTLRTIDEDFRESAHHEMLDISNKIAQEYNVDIHFDIRKGYPCLINDEYLTESSIGIAKDYLGQNNVVELPVRMTAEDFAYYSQVIPSCFYRLGTANQEKGIANRLHTSTFNIDEESLEIGMGLLAYLAIMH
jgi:amidohydrolase